MPRLLLPAAAAISAAALLGACSNSSDSSGTTGSVSSPSTASAPSTAASAAGRVSAATLEGVLLRTGDVPASYQARARRATNSDDGSNGVARSVAPCIGASTPPVVSTSGRQRSPNFTRGESTITSSARPGDQIAGQQRFYEEALASSKSESCFEKTYGALFAKAFRGGKINRVDVDLSGRTSGQPKTVQANFDVQASITAQGQTRTLYFSTAAILSDDIEADVSSTALDKPVPDDVRNAAVNAVARRVADT